MEPREVDVLLIGGGVAAARCARTLRRRGFTGSIVLVGEEPAAPYNRPPLSKEVLRGEVPDELVVAEPPSFYERRSVELLTGVPVAALSPDDRLAELADGLRLHYGQALLATGATPRRLGSLPGALVLRTLADARALRDAAVPGTRVTVVGGGFIGVEASASLTARGALVTLLEREPALWAGTLGEAVSTWAVACLRDAGVDVRLETVPDGSPPAEVLLAGVGVTPRTELAETAGLRVDDGVVVDERQATSAAWLFAAGDVARCDGGYRVEHWHAARESGERAALAMLDEPIPAARAAWVFSEFAGHQLDVFGVTDGTDELPAAGGRAFLRDGRVVGLAIVDGAIDPEEARSFVERRPAVAELETLAPRA